MIVYNADQEVSQAADGWYDDRRDFPAPGEIDTAVVAPKKPRGKPGRKPKAKE
jgi:hypothetical protein